MIIRKRKLKLQSGVEEIVPINKKYEKREKNREAAALKAAQLENAIEKQLLQRLRAGTYKEEDDILNVD